MRSIKQLFKDIYLNIKWAHIGLALDIEDPWFRREAEKEMKARGVKFIYTYAPDGAYTYAIVGGKKADIHGFVDWFKTHDNWHYYIGYHQYFKTDIVFLKY